MAETIDELNARRDAINDQMAALRLEKEAIAEAISSQLEQERAVSLLADMSPGQVDAVAHAASVILNARPQEPSNG